MLPDFVTQKLLNSALALYLLAGSGTRLETSGKTFYVAPDGEDETAQADNRLRPFKSLTKGVEALANGDTLEVAEGVYRVTPGYPSAPPGFADYAPMQLSGRTNLTIVGRGNVEIYGEGPGDFLLIENCSAIRIESIHFKGNRPGVPTATLPPGYSWLYSTVLLRGFNDTLYFDGCRFTGFGNHAISHLYEGKRSYNMVVTNCYFADGGYGGGEIIPEDGAAISGISSRSLIVNNVIERCFRGIEIEGAYQGSVVTNILIQGNVLRNCYTLGIMLFGTGSLETDYADIKIRNNRVLDMQNHPDYPRHSFGIWISAGLDVEITGNEVIGNRSGGGISMNSAALPVKRALVARNYVSNALTQGIVATQHGNNTFDSVVVEQNKVVLTGEHGILLNGSGIMCRSNYVENSGWRALYGVMANGGIEMNHQYLGSTNSYILDNRVLNTTNQYSLHGVWIRPGATGTVIAGNLFTNMPRAGIQDEGVATVVLPKILDLTLAEDTVGILVSGYPRKNHVVEGTSDFQNWQTQSSFVAPNDAGIRIEIIQSGRTSYRFYRLRGEW
jgi:hypothetical protein